MVEHHCLQLAEESYCLYFQLNSEILQLLTEEGNDFWFELSGGSRNGDSTVWSAPYALSDFFGERAVERKIMQQQLYVKKQI